MHAISELEWLKQIFISLVMFVKILTLKQYRWVMDDSTTVIVIYTRLQKFKLFNFILHLYVPRSER